MNSLSIGKAKETIEGGILIYEKLTCSEIKLMEKTYQKGSTFIDYGLIHRELIDKVDRVTYKPFGYRKAEETIAGGILIYGKLTCSEIKLLECISQRVGVFIAKTAANNSLIISGQSAST